MCFLFNRRSHKKVKLLALDHNILFIYKSCGNALFYSENLNFIFRFFMLFFNLCFKSKISDFKVPFFSWFLRFRLCRTLLPWCSIFNHQSNRKFLLLRKSLLHRHIITYIGVVSFLSKT